MASNTAKARWGEKFDPEKPSRSSRAVADKAWEAFLTVEGEVELKDEHTEALENIQADMIKLYQRSVGFLNNEPKKGDAKALAADIFNGSINPTSFFHIAITRRYDKAEE